MKSTINYLRTVIEGHKKTLDRLQNDKNIQLKNIEAIDSTMGKITDGLKELDEAISMLENKKPEELVGIKRGKTNAK